MTRITTVIPTFERPHLVGRAIQSVLSQTHTDVVVCVYDNSSNDSTESVVCALAARDPRVFYHRHPTNIGMAANYNFGLSRVETPFYSVLGDDDFLLPHHFQDAIAALTAEREAGFFCAPTFVHDEALSLTLPRNRSWRSGRYAVDGENVAHMVRDHFIGNGVLYRRAILDTVGLYDRFASDRNYVILASARHPFIVSERQSGVLTLHARGFSSGGRSVGFANGAEFSHGISYALGERRELLARLSQTSMPRLGTAMGAAKATARRDLLYLFATRSLHGGDAPGDARLLLSVRREFAFGSLLVTLLRLMAPLLSVRLVAKFVGLAVWCAYRTAMALGAVMRRVSGSD